MYDCEIVSIKYTITQLESKIDMKNLLLLTIATVLLFSCSTKSILKDPTPNLESITSNLKRTSVKNIDELNEAISEADPGDEIVLTNGIWEDAQINFIGMGTEDAPITLRAETAGKVMLQGASNLKLGGEHLVVDGLYFTNGASPSRSVIQFFIDKETIANNCRVTNCVIEDFNQAQKNKQDLWVLFKGRHNQLDHCYLAGKSNRGPTVRVDLAGNESIKNYHKIISSIDAMGKWRLYLVKPISTNLEIMFSTKAKAHWLPVMEIIAQWMATILLVMRNPHTQVA